jgi:hypothetical protein
MGRRLGDNYAARMSAYRSGAGDSDVSRIATSADAERIAIQTVTKQEAIVIEKRGSALSGKRAKKTRKHCNTRYPSRRKRIGRRLTSLGRKDSVTTKEKDSMAKSRRRSRAAKHRKRDSKGHFIKSSSASEPRRRRRRRHAAESSPNPRRRRRRNPWYGHPRKHAKAARKGWRRRRSHRRASAPRRRRRGITAAGNVRVRRGGRRGRGSPAHIHVHIGPKRRSSRRRHASAPRRRRRSHARRRRYEYTPPSRQLAADSYALSNPLSGGELVLVAITGGLGYALADFAGRYMETTAVSGGSLNAVPAGATVPNNIATAAFPSWQAMATQAGVAAVPLGLSAFVDSPWGRAALQGAGLGAFFALFGGLFKSAMASLLANQALGQQLYADEILAQQAVAAAGGTTTSSATAGFSGLPRGRGVGRPALLRTATIGRGVGTAIASALVPPQSRVPVGVPQNSNPNAIPGAGPANPNPPTQVYAPPGIMTNTGSIVASPPPGTMTPSGPSNGSNCAPCTSTAGGIAGTYGTAQQAIRDESCLGKVPGMYATFPE